MAMFLSPNASADDKIDFTRHIRPILAEYCFACHGFDSSSREAGLRLDLRDAAVESGAINSEHPNESLLLERIFSDDHDLVMPPISTKKVLSTEHKKLLRTWIEQGANYEEHWAYQLPKKGESPATVDNDWAKNPIDSFVLEKLKANGLIPAPPADPAVLFRRLHLDITGLLPAPDDLKQFLVEYHQDQTRAISDWIDRLMETPAWGEHRGRYWLDAARYGDTHGMHFDNYREMWPYRDWVIMAFNSNLPYDQFVIQQLAGDLLSNPTTEQLVATGFQRCNITTNEGGTIEEENLALYSADRVQTFSWIFLGLTMNCAQCHDHKFDAITSRDYYAMAAFFRNTTQRGLDGNSKDGNASILHLPSEADEPRWSDLPAEIAKAKTDLEHYRGEAYAKFLTELSSIEVESLKQKIPLDGLELHAPFTDGSGEQVKTSRGTSLVSLAQTNWIPDGKFGAAAEITPQSSFLVGDAGNWDFDQKFSYGAWVKPKDRNSTGAVIARMDTGNRFRGWDLMQANARYHVHLIDSWSDNAIKVRTLNEVVVGDRWQHVFVTYDGSRRPEGIRIYVDGVVQPQTTDNNSLQPNASFRTDTPTRIGQRRADNYWSGSVQELRLYGRALTAKEVGDIVQGDELALLLMLDESARTPERIEQAFNAVVPLFDIEYKSIVDRLSSLEKEYNEIRQRSPITHIQQERPNSEAQTELLMRGEYDKKGELVKADTPAALHPFPPDFPRNRLGLANWVVDPKNPVTARVTVNRFWTEMFGNGLVATTEDFGVMGSPPTHPELLDWLAVDFVENGWDVKRIYKQIMTSATYRQAAIISPEKLEIDPQNLLLSRGPRFRMDAEMIRDFALKTSGLLSSKMYGPSVKPYQPENIWNVVGLREGNTRDYVQDDGENLYRRSLYSFWKRMAHPPNMELLNAPSREVCVTKRERTNTPLQALVTLNDPIFVEAARNLAQQALKSIHTFDPNTVSTINEDENSNEGNNSQEGKKFNERLTAGDDNLADPSKAKSVKSSITLNQIALIVLNRQLSEAETKLLTEDLKDYLDHYSNNLEDAKALVRVGRSPYETSLDTAELAAWTMICQQFLNLDEAITK